MLDNLIRAGRHAFFGDNNRMHRLAPCVVGNTDYGNFGDRVMGGNGAFDFGRKTRSRRR